MFDVTLMHYSGGPYYGPPLCDPTQRVNGAHNTLDWCLVTCVVCQVRLEGRSDLPHLCNRALGFLLAEERYGQVGGHDESCK